MKIATWNLDRPTASSKDKNQKIAEYLKDVDADLLVLTETNWAIDSGSGYTPLASDLLPNPGNYFYTHGENQTTIWSKYPLSRIETYNSAVSVCAKIKSPRGDLIVYGTVIGILGVVGHAAKADFLLNLKEQIEDWKRILAEEGDLCIVGDFNVCWSKGFPNAGRNDIDGCFDELGILNLTRNIERNIDHIAVSESWLKHAQVEVLKPWNDPPDKAISDHKGVCVRLESRKSEANEENG